jgi:hypothetical protein
LVAAPCSSTPLPFPSREDAAAFQLMSSAKSTTAARPLHPARWGTPPLGRRAPRNRSCILACGFAGNWKVYELLRIDVYHDFAVKGALGIWNKHLVSHIVSKPGTYSVAISKDCVTCSRGPDARWLWRSLTPIRYVPCSKMHDLQNHQDALFLKDVSVYGSMLRPTLVDI